VIFEKNSEPAIKNAKNTCSTGGSGILVRFDNREEQGEQVRWNTDQAVRRGLDPLNLQRFCDPILRSVSWMEAGVTAWPRSVVWISLSVGRNFCNSNSKNNGFRPCLGSGKAQLEPGAFPPRLNAYRDLGPFAAPSGPIDLSRVALAYIPISFWITSSESHRAAEPAF
jgi:hypothetical protein